jgi:hypothetical protein
MNTNILTVDEPANHANRGESIAVSRIVCFKSGCVQIAATAAEQSLSFDLKHPVPTSAYSHSR